MTKTLRRVSLSTLLLAGATALPAHAGDVPVSLRGSPASMERQNEVAREEHYTFLETPEEVRKFVEDGRLVPLTGNADYEMARGVSFPYARPEVLRFVEIFAAQHRAGCGQPLVVTSLTRPQARQPGNAHALSVHPTGMAVDLRVDRDAECRKWLEFNLLALEADGVLDVTRERNPPHFHVAIFPGAFRAWAEKNAPAAPPAEPAAAPSAPAEAANTAPVPVARAERAAEAEGGREVPRAGEALVAAVILGLFVAALAMSAWSRRHHGHDGDDDGFSGPGDWRPRRA